MKARLTVRRVAGAGRGSCGAVEVDGRLDRRGSCAGTVDYQLIALLLTPVFLIFSVFAAMCYLVFGPFGRGHSASAPVDLYTTNAMGNRVLGIKVTNDFSVWSGGTLRVYSYERGFNDALMGVALRQLYNSVVGTNESFGATARYAAEKHKVVLDEAFNVEVAK